MFLKNITTPNTAPMITCKITAASRVYIKKFCHYKYFRFVLDVKVNNV